jgi:enoyl-CoA hydratase/carnithine racemase
MSEVKLERSGAAAIVVINRPDRRNALDRATLNELGRVGRELGADASVRAALLTGSGDKAFCAGADLKERAGMSEDEVRAMLRAYRTELAWLGSSPFPVIAAVNGAALGGGFELALACDLRVATIDAVFGLPETSLGIIPAAGGTQRLPRLAGQAKALELILLGTRLTAAEALALGIVNRVAAPGTDIVQDALGWLEPVLAGPPLAMRAALEAVRAAATMPLGEGLAAELAAYEACLVSEDRKEALAAFAERRKPNFRGR